ncbi:MAG: redoxin domain-containing protein [Planctomycetes bacterium]|nr:redoxin domain-containing protein [Planctomycetota bacterium]
MKRSLTLVVALCGLAFGGSVALAQAAKEPESVKMPAKKEAEVKAIGVGDDAPELKFEKWLKGTEIKGLDKTKTYVVEFWATWCGPCRVAIPHLTEMSHEFKDKVTFIGMSVWESDGLDKVESFVREQGDKMDYNVAYAGAGNETHMSQAWLKAAGQDGIPASFVVDKGKIVWIGHPMDGLDKTLKEVTSGTFDLNKAIAKAAKDKEARAKSNAIQKKLGTAIKAGNHAEVLAAFDELYAVDNEMFQGVIPGKFNYMLTKMKETDKAYAYIAPHVTSTFKDDAQGLNQIAWLILTAPGVEKRDFKLATSAAERAVEVTKGKDGAILDTLAKAYFESGDKAKAIETQKKAISVADGEMKTELEDTLKQYEGGSAKK